MNKRIFTILFIIFSVFVFMGAVCAENVTEDADIISATDSDVLTVDDGKFTFRDLNATINSANNVVEITEDYTFDEGIDGNLDEGIKIDRDNITINGNNHTIDGKNQARFFKITGHNIVINDLILKNGYNSSIVDYGSLRTSNVEFNNCSSDEGAALYISEAEYVSENDKFIANNVDDGIINSYESNITVNRGFFDNNFGKRGSAIYAEASALTVTDSLLSNSHSNWSSVFMLDSYMFLSNTTFVNSTSKYATAIYGENSWLNIVKSRFVNLYASNTAGTLGFKENTYVSIDGCEFINSASRKNGGAIFIDVPGESDEFEGVITINNTLFEGCLSGFGGAFLQLGGNLSISNSNFTSNFAEFNGGALYLSYADAYIENCIFKLNSAFMGYEEYPTYGGAVFCDNSILTLFDSEFISNSAVEGGALYMYDTQYCLENLVFNENTNPVRSYFDKGSQKSGLKGKDNILDDDFNNTEYYNVFAGEGVEMVLLNNTVNVTSLPARYDLREENLVTPVKNQGHMGACWAFGATAALESAMMKAWNYTACFSENNMQNSMLRYSIAGIETALEGGANSYSMAYLVSWIGAFPDDYDAYDELGKISPFLSPYEKIHLQDVIILSHVPGDEASIKNVKEHILRYGALDSCLLSKSTDDADEPTGYYNEDTAAEYNPEHSYSNHEVCVVGWDDNFSADNFAITPPGDGAWIIKNSWGSDWGDNGYFYVSYYDQTMCAFPEKFTESFMAFSFENNLPYNNNYQYDFSPVTSFHTGNYDEICYLNEFEAYEDDVIAAVGTYFNKPGVEYTVDIYVNNDKVYTQSGISPFAGFHTIKLDKYISVKKGDNFSASIKSNAMPFCANMRLHHEGGSYYTFDGKIWSDLVAQNLVACLKIYTLPDLIKTENIKQYFSDNNPFIVNVNRSNVSVSVSVENITLTNLSDENGTAVFALPALDVGVHVITTVFDGVSIINTVAVLSTIDVASEITVGYNANASVNVTYYDAEGNLIASAAFPVINKIGSYSANFTNYLTNQTVASKINVVSRFSGNKNINMYYFDGSKYSFKIYGDDGKLAAGQLVKIKIGKKTYKVKSNDAGVVNLKIPSEITPGTYSITVTYAGQTVKNTLKVKKTLSAKKITVKKTSKKLVLKATLKNGKKPIKGKVITFKFNGKTYKVKTNSKGVAQKVLKKNVIKKLKKGKTYTVKVTFLKNTIKSSVKVK